MALVSVSNTAHREHNNATFVVEELRRFGIHVEVLRHKPVRTVAETKALGHRLSGSHLKSLLLRDRGTSIYLVCVLEDRQLDMKRLRRQLGAKGSLSFLDADRVLEILSVEPGAVSPLAALNAAPGSINLVLDALVLRGQLVNCALMSNTITVALNPSALIEFLRSKGIKPLVHEFDGE